MKRRQWSSQEKLKIILEGLSGQIEISKLCQKYQIHQNQYYQWHDQFTEHFQKCVCVSAQTPSREVNGQPRRE
ncbi:MAG: hypothetical protein COV74_02125 [Candidatus Omnitrophica bacterium CG11_big_fil_rev_8_21_14_0_20_45_26]|uniref:Transposase n=1 Tax=Candidatus Abzuiibacterium crystallinum TaxID=1974748 RepID=A0A2H0LRQ8_9BACT|nr:MAG: hypothetical protein COV74_02125 [Candidatus Omnitrophica bacterium CG11_big_fil_rev_8_21_14_0_20_45_26]PIW64878.1 MAG: hypothetical protein COW12_04365 [Candidatus Omnitrophica bacterium CG12_big_fil_rev_8_21_14_0_65_45_16]